MRYLMLLAGALIVGCGSGGDSSEDSTATACGGLQGLQCTKTEYCKFPRGTCGAADELGECSATPSVCTEIFLPVCGCDGITYGNECAAATAGVSIVSSGSCD